MAKRSRDVASSPTENTSTIKATSRGQSRDQPQGAESLGPAAGGLGFRAVEVAASASRFESPQLHQVVGANRPGFPAPTLLRLFSAVARKLMVCGVCSALTTGLGRRT